MLSFNNAGVPGWEDRAIRVGWPVVLRFAKRRLGHQAGHRAPGRGDRLARVRLRGRAARRRPAVPGGRPVLRGGPDLRRARGADGRPAGVHGGAAAARRPGCRRSRAGSSSARASTRPGRHALKMFREHRRELVARLAGFGLGEQRARACREHPLGQLAAERGRDRRASPSTRSRIQADPSGSPAYASTREPRRRRARACAPTGVWQVASSAVTTARSAVSSTSARRSVIAAASSRDLARRRCAPRARGSPGPARA